MNLSIIMSFICLSRFCNSLRAYSSKSSIPSRRCLKINCHADLSHPAYLQSLNTIVNDYDIFLLDQFGVLHDGTVAIPGAIDSLVNLSQRDKSLVIVSNSSSRAKNALSKLRELGFLMNFKGVVTSGETAWQYLKEYYSGKKCVWVTWNSFRDDSFLADCDIKVSDVHHADFILFHGTQTIVSDLSRPKRIDVCQTGVISEQLKEILSFGIKRGIPAVCANMDKVAMTPVGLLYMPGFLAEYYESEGGKIIPFGKPLIDHFQTAIGMATHLTTGTGSNINYKRIIHVGDSIIHDVLGAHNTGISSLLITDYGIHMKDFLGEKNNNCLDKDNLSKEQRILERVCYVSKTHNVSSPTFIMKELRF